LRDRNTGFRVKPGMTDKGKEQALCATRSTTAQGRPVRQAQDMLLGKHNINCGMRIAECRIVRRNSRRSLETEVYTPIF
jgi:hypothetical protein